MPAIAFLVLSAALLAPDPAAQAQLERGHAAVRELEYEAAAEEFMGVATSTNASDEQKLEANLHAGIAHRILGNNVEAKLHFMYVLTRVPDTPLPQGQPPKVTGFYELIRDEAVQLRQLQAVAGRAQADSTSAPPTTSPTSTSAAPSAPSEMIEESATDSGPSPLFIAGLVTAGVGVAVLVGAITSGVITDAVFASPDVDTDVRELAQVASFLVWIPGIAGTIALAAGGGIAMGTAE